VAERVGAHEVGFRDWRDVEPVHGRRRGAGRVEEAVTRKRNPAAVSAGSTGCWVAASTAEECVQLLRLELERGGELEQRGEARVLHLVRLVVAGSLLLHPQLASPEA